MPNQDNTIQLVQAWLDTIKSEESHKEQLLLRLQTNWV